MISRHPLLTQVLEEVQSFRSGLVYLHAATNEMEPTSWREAQRKADEKVHLLRHMQRASVVVNTVDGSGSAALLWKWEEKQLIPRSSTITSNPEVCPFICVASMVLYTTYMIKMRYIFSAITHCVCDSAVISQSESHFYIFGGMASLLLYLPDFPHAAMEWRSNRNVQYCIGQTAGVGYWANQSRVRLIWDGGGFINGFGREH